MSRDIGNPKYQHSLPYEGTLLPLKGHGRFTWKKDRHQVFGAPTRPTYDNEAGHANDLGMDEVGTKMKMPYHDDDDDDEDDALSWW